MTTLGFRMVNAALILFAAARLVATPYFRIVKPFAHVLVATTARCKKFLVKDDGYRAPRPQ
jgi:hypothetical protein